MKTYKDFAYLGLFVVASFLFVLTIGLSTEASTNQMSEYEQAASPEYQVDLDEVVVVASREP